jgi:hypothetical protein
MRTSSRPGRVFGPTALRRNVTDSSVPSNTGVRIVALAEMNSAAATSATMRSSPAASVSARCTRAKPRFQFGSHCAVMVVSAARITPISAVASSASTSVKPAMLARRGVIASASGAAARC